MPTPTYTPLATVTLGSSASSVTFSSIPATYRDLILVFDGTISNAVDIYLRFNSDSGSNYSFVQMSGNGSTTASSSGTITYGQISNSASGRVTAIAQLMDYSATDKHKTFLSRQTNDPVRAWAVRWANTSAINTMLLAVASGTISSGSVISLYGVIA
jgi:hypothetical protein